MSVGFHLPSKQSFSEANDTIFGRGGVESLLVDDQALQLNGFIRAAEDVRVLLKPGRTNSEKNIWTLGFCELPLRWTVSGFKRFRITNWKIFESPTTRLKIYSLL